MRGVATCKRKLLPRWAADETWGRYFWDWANPTQNCLTTPDAARYLLDHPAAFPQWRHDARNMLTLFLHHSSVAPDSRGDVYSGAWAYPESSSCCGRSLWYSPLLVAPVLAQYGVQADSPWCRELAYRQLVLQTYDVHETGVTEDNIDGGVIVNGQWFNIAHPLPLRWVLAAIAWLPAELGASRENHIVRSSAVVNSVVYGPGHIAYTTFDAPDETLDVLRLAFAPQAVTADGQPLAERQDLAGNGFLVTRLPNGDAVVSIRHDGARCITVRGEDPQRVLDQDALLAEGPWKTVADEAAYGGSLQVADAAGASVTARFEGHQVRVVGRVDASGGRAAVELDGVPQLVPIDCWNPKPRQQQVLYYKNGLTPGAHTLRIVARGEKNPYAQGTCVYLDAVQYSTAGEAFHFPTGTGPQDTQRMLFGTLSREDYRDTQGQSWRPATEFVVRLASLKDAVAECWWTQPVTAPIGGTADAELYRYGVHARDFWVNVTVGPGTYYARLKLAATRGREQSSPGFAIRINGRIVVPNLDVVATAGGPNRAVDLIFPGLTPQRGIIEVRLTGTRRMADDQVVQDEAYLQALEVGPGGGSPGTTPVSAPLPKLAGNLLENPGFEQTAGGVVGQTGQTARAAGWTYTFLGPQTSYVWQERDYAKHPEWGLPEIHTGQGALRTHTDAVGHTRVFQEVDVAPHTAYAASVWVRTADLHGQGFGRQAGDSAGLAIGELNEAGQVVRQHELVGVQAAAPYQQLTQRFTTGPATVQVRFLLDSVLNCTYTEGHVTYDDCSLRAETE